MMLGDKVEAGEPLDAARIALYDFAFARMMAPAPPGRSTAGDCLRAEPRATSHSHGAPPRVTPWPDYAVIPPSREHLAGE